MAADPVDPLPDPAPTPPARPRRTTCTFCECQLDHNGEYLRLSDRARTLRDQEETIRSLEAEKGKIERELAALKAATQPAAPGARAGLRL